MSSDKEDYTLIQHDIKEKERPPMGKVKEYQKLIKELEKTAQKNKYENSNTTLSP
jgi:hypothetical protein